MDGSVYTVREGDTWGSIASALNVTESSLAAANPGTLIEPGARLALPEPDEIPVNASTGDAEGWFYYTVRSGDTLSGSVYLTVGWQESDVEGSGYSDIAAADLTGGNDGVVIDDAAEDAVVVQRGYIGSKRYVRAYVAFTGTHTNGTPISALVVKHYLRHQPPTIAP